RLVLEVAYAVDRAGRWQHQEIDTRHLRRGLAPQIAEFIVSLESIDGTVLPSTQDDLARHRPDARLVTRAFQEGADCGRALGYPRAAIEQLGGVAKGRVVERHRRAAQVLQARDRLAIERGISPVAEELGIGGLQHAEPEVRGYGRRRMRGCHDVEDDG